MLPKSVAVVGAGPVGCLAALGLAERGCSVDIYESRKDPRQEETSETIQRSINLAISTRGLTGLRSVNLNQGKVGGDSMDLADMVLADSVPMHARMIHLPNTSKDENGVDVRLDSQEYGINHECINSVDRARLNNLLLERAVAHPRIQVNYQHRLRNIDFDAGERRRAKQRRSDQNPTLSDDSSSEEEEGEVLLEFDLSQSDGSSARRNAWADLVVGCDGIHSAVRSQLAKVVRMDFTQTYIDNGYVELSIPAKNSVNPGSKPRGIGSHDAFQLDPGHLHIWPRHEFMLIALPNPSGNFTCTLFAPFSIFQNSLTNPQDIIAFFKKHFADALPLIGQESLVRDIMSRRPSPLGSVKCKPYHYKNRCVVIGDAAHAMLPFYGQGLNCGFEDVRVLLENIDKEQEPASSEEDHASTFERSRSSSPVGSALKMLWPGASHHRLDSGVEVSPSGSPRRQLKELELERKERSRPVERKQGKDGMSRALDSYTEGRYADLIAISELAENNYAEMCSKVTTYSYLLRKKFDTLLMSTLPTHLDWWTSLYTMVTFSNVKYSHVRQRELRQAKIVKRLAWTVGFTSIVTVAVGVARWRRSWN